MGRHKIELPVTAAELRKLYEVHRLTTYQIADRLGCHHLTVKDRIVRSGGVMRKMRPKERNRKLTKPYVYRIPPNKKPISTDCIKIMYLEEGKSLKEIGKDVGMSHEGVRQRLKVAGVKIKPRGENSGRSKIAVPTEEIIHLYVKEKLSLSVVAKMLGISYHVTRRKLKDLNVPIRTYSEARSLTIYSHCPQGHEFTPENTYRLKNGNGGLARRCKTCCADAARRKRTKVAA